MFHCLWVMIFFSPIVQIWDSFDLILEWLQNDRVLEWPIISQFKQNGLKNVLLTSKEPPPFWVNFDFMTSKGLLKLQILEKWRKIKFFTSKSIHGSKLRIFYCRLVAIYCFETALKNFEKWHQRGAPPFYMFL